jgi:uncharacterized membrane protein
MLHASEVHGATTHLAVVAVIVYGLLLLVRRTRWDGPVSRGSEPWVLGAAILGIATAGVTGLIVRGQAQTVLRNGSNRVGTAHFWLGIALALLVLAPVAVRMIAARRGEVEAAAVATPWLLLSLLALVAVAAQGYLGGRMTYEHGVGVDAGGQFRQSAVGAERLELALASGTDPAKAGKAAFSEKGLGCSTCHGELAPGARGPGLGGGKKLDEFRRKHAGGLFPAEVVTDRDFQAIDAYLKTLPRR